MRSAPGWDEREDGAVSFCCLKALDESLVQCMSSSVQAALFNRVESCWEPWRRWKTRSKMASRVSDVLVWRQKRCSGWKVEGLGSFVAEQYLRSDDVGLDR